MSCGRCCCCTAAVDPVVASIAAGAVRVLVDESASVDPREIIDGDVARLAHIGALRVGEGALGNYTGRPGLAAAAIASGEGLCDGVVGRVVVGQKVHGRDTRVRHSGGDGGGSVGEEGAGDALISNVASGRTCTNFAHDDIATAHVE